MSISPKGTTRPSWKRRSWGCSAGVKGGIGWGSVTIGNVEERVGVLSGVLRHGGQYKDVVDPWEWRWADLPQHACKILVWSGIAENGSVKCTSGCSGCGKIWWVVDEEVFGTSRGGTWCCRRKLLAECRMMAGSWVKSKVSKKVSMGCQVSTPLLSVSTIQSSSGRGVIGKQTFLNWIVWTVEEVGIILAMRGIYERDEGSSWLKKWVPFGVEVDETALAWAFEWAGVVAMARCGVRAWNTKEQGSSEVYDAMKKVSWCINGSVRNQCEMMSVWWQDMEETVLAKDVPLFPDSELTWAAYLDEVEKKGCPHGVTRTWTVKAMSWESGWGVMHRDVWDRAVKALRCWWVFQVG